MFKLSKKVIGLTGKIASGKSAISNYLISKNYNVIDADLITNDIYLNDTNFKNKMIRHFSNNILTNDSIDKSKVAKIVFDDLNQMNKLNSIIHPLIVAKIKEKLNKIDGIVFIDAALLFETNLDSICDLIILVSVDKEIQLNRLMKRNNLSKDDALKRIKSQFISESNLAKVDYIIENNDTLDTLYNEIDKILEKIEMR